MRKQCAKLKSAILQVPGTFLSLAVEVCKSSLKAPTKVQWLGLTKRRVAVVLVVAVGAAFASCSGGLLLLLLELLFLPFFFRGGGTCAGCSDGP